MRRRIILHSHCGARSLGKYDRNLESSMDVHTVASAFPQPCALGKIGALLMRNWTLKCHTYNCTLSSSGRLLASAIAGRRGTARHGPAWHEIPCGNHEVPAHRSASSGPSPNMVSAAVMLPRQIRSLGTNGALRKAFVIDG